MPRFHVHNFGCRANQADGAMLAVSLEASGWTAAGAAEADCVVFNTCTVTAAADLEAQRAIRRLRRERPEAKIVVTGCYAQRAPREVAALEGVSLVAGNDRKPELVALLGGDLQLPKLAREAQRPIKTRPTVKVQDGCDLRCSYCVIPLVRGASRSLPLGGVLEQIQKLVEAGCQEIVISGINLGQWGRDLDSPLAPRRRLPDLIRAILEQTALPRLRLSSVEPADWASEWTPMLAEFLEPMGAAAGPRLARHFHLPLQSGSNAVLRRMRRRYRIEDYAATIAELRRRVPQAALGADVMVGFPGESEREFEETLAFVASAPLTYLHVFAYSSREGTEAARNLAEAAWTPVAAGAAAERGHALRRLIAAKRAEFLAAQVGARLSVVTLAEARAEGCWGLSDNFVNIGVAEAAEPNRMFEVEVEAAHGDHLEGRRARA